MRRKIKRIAAAFLALTALSGCGFLPQAYFTGGHEDTAEPPAEEPDDNTTAHEKEIYLKADSVFSVNYSAAQELNPMRSTGYYNEQLFSLLYEGLFALTGDLKAVPVLCESYTTEDGRSYYLKILEDVKFHDGTELTTQDVVYSLNTARSSSKYSARLSDISAVAPAQEPMTVKITLRRANYALPALLDVPIIKDGSADGASPVGTGPYMLGSGMLIAFSSHRDYASTSLRTIYLKEIDPDDMADAFADRSLDIVGYDPTGSVSLNIHMVHETRYYDTSDLVYLGFNCKRGPTSDTFVRQALSRLVNHDAIISDAYGNAARRSILLVNPALGLVDDINETGYGYSRANYNRLAAAAGLEDTDLDSFTDYNGEPMSLRLIVNSESTAKLEAAQRIVSDMQDMGINVTLESMSFSNYQRALSQGNFDMYLAEVRLKADLDFGALFYGKLNYGGIQGDEYRQLVLDFLGKDGEEKSEAALALDIYTAEDASIVPIAWKQRTVLTHLGVVTGLAPSQSGIYNGVLGWKVNLDRD